MLQSAHFEIIITFNILISPVHMCKETTRASARSGKVSIVLRLLHKFHRENRLLMLAFALALHM